MVSGSFTRIDAARVDGTPINADGCLVVACRMRASDVSSVRKK